MKSQQPVFQPHFWNVWWTLTILAGAFTILVVLLEYLGVFGDVGLFLGATGIIVTVIFRSRRQVPKIQQNGISMGRLHFLEFRLSSSTRRRDSLLRSQRKQS